MLCVVFQLVFVVVPVLNFVKVTLLIVECAHVLNNVQFVYGINA